MVKKLLFAVSAISILGLTSCGGNKPDFNFDVVGNSYVAKNSKYQYNATKSGVIDTNVTWSVDRPELGSIDANGVLTINADSGAIKVIAVSNENKSKRATHSVEIVGESITKDVFLSNLKSQEEEFWSLFGEHYKREISTTHRESDFILYNGEPTVIKSIRYRILRDGEIKRRSLNCTISDTEVSDVDYPDYEKIVDSFKEFEKYEKEVVGFSGYRDYFTFTKDGYDYISYYLEYEYEDSGKTTSKLVYRAFTSGFIINYLEINDEQPEIYLHLTPVEP